MEFDVSTPRYPNLTASVDDEDSGLVFDGGPRWVAMQAKRTFYVVRREGGRKGKFVLLHRRILGLTDPLIKGDHRNGDGLDNLRENLRTATNQQNSQNGRSHCDSTSKYRGVSWDAARGKWTAGIGLSGKRVGLGRFDIEEDAALAYDAAARQEYGEFAKLNFPEVPCGI